jgi:biotin carboxyl carrier protein
MTAEPAAGAQAAPAPTPTASPTRAPVTGSGELTAPLPGTVVTIAVAEGDTVEAGQELLVLEAMKMKNPIRAKQGGTVTAVHVNVGDQVQHGAPLLTLEA